MHKAKIRTCEGAMTDILIVEDNLEIAKLLGDFLERDSYSYHIAASGEHGLAYLKAAEVRLVILDIMLPGIDGFEVCKEIRDTYGLPVIVLSARADKESKLTGFSLGADDYLEKPYDVDLLLAKIKNLLQRSEPAASKKRLLCEGELTIDKAARKVFYSDTVLELSAKEFDLIVYLAEHKGEAIRKETLFHEVWGSESLSEPSTVTVHIKWLRDKIEADPKNPRYLKTVWGVGYVFGLEDEGRLDG